jgi:hypothetical protein
MKTKWIPKIGDYVWFNFKATPKYWLGWVGDIYYGNNVKFVYHWEGHIQDKQAPLLYLSPATKEEVVLWMLENV